MKFTNVLAGTALAALVLTGGLAMPGALSPATSAEAAVNISIGVFYDQLGRYGDWVNYRDEYVFIPGNVDAGWRPYTRGHWVFTKRYGWTWASDEPFGWATYHYGRWGYAEDIGWYWVPGRRWAPAWVSWRRSKDYVVWAPLPPARHRGADVSISISVNDIPDYYWVAVPTRRFLAPDLRVVVVQDDREVIRRTKYIGTPRITNNIVVNNVIDVNVISRETGTRVRPVEVRTTQNPADAHAGADQVTVFQGELQADTNAKPPKVSDVGQVKKVKRGQGGTDAKTTVPADSTTTTTPPATTGTDTTTGATPAVPPPPAKGKDKTKASDTTTTGTGSDNATSGATPAVPPKPEDKTRDTTKSDTGETTAPPAASTTEQSAPQDQQTGKRKKKPAADTQDNATTGDQGTNPNPPAEAAQPSQKPKKDSGSSEAPSQDQSAPQDNAGSGNNGNGNGNAKGKGKKNQEPCDPSTNADCAPAQQ